MRFQRPTQLLLVLAQKLPLVLRGKPGNGPTLRANTVVHPQDRPSPTHIGLYTARGHGSHDGAQVIVLD